LAPGAAAIFAGSYLIPCVTNLTTNTVGVVTTNIVGVITTNIVRVVTTNTFLVVTTNSTGTVPSNLVASTFGTISPAGSSGTVTDRFEVGTNFHGLTYSDSDQIGRASCRERV